MHSQVVGMQELSLSRVLALAPDTSPPPPLPPVSIASNSRPAILLIWIKFIQSTELHV